MKKLDIGNSETVLPATQEGICRLDETKYDHRLHGLLLVANGQSRRQASGRESAHGPAWVRSYQRDGFDGLREGARSGPAPLDETRRRALELDLRDRPDRFGLVGHLWDGPLLREHLRRSYGVKMQPGAFAQREKPWLKWGERTRLRHRW